MRVVQVKGPGFETTVGLAAGFMARLRGLGAASGGVILPTRSVHTFWMRRAIGVAALDASLRVLETKVVPPRRVMTTAGARWYLELPPPLRLPEVGSRLEIVDG